MSIGAYDHIKTQEVQLVMNIEFIKNPVTGVLEAWEDGRVIGEFVSTGMLAKGWKLTDCIVRKEQGFQTGNES